MTTDDAPIGEVPEDVDEHKLALALSGKLEPSALNTAERAVWSERFLAMMAEPGPDEKAFFAEMRARGGATGIDEHGNLVVLDADGTERILMPASQSTP